MKGGPKGGPKDEAGVGGDVGSGWGARRGAVGLLYCLLASLFADLSVVFGKVSSLLFLGVVGGGVGLSGVPAVAWVVVGCYVVSLVADLLLVDASLSVNDVTYHVPTYYVFWIIGSVVAGGVFYGELDGFLPWRFAVFIVGLCVLLCGLGVLHVSAGRKEGVCGAGDGESGVTFAVALGLVDGVFLGDGAGGGAGVGDAGKGGVCLLYTSPSPRD